MSILASEMSQRHGGWLNNFEVVIVPKMRMKWDNDEGVFHHCIYAFPNCLAVPFTHKYHCDHICKSLNFEGEPKLVYVDPTMKVLQVEYHPMVKYGARGFPFTEDHLWSLYHESLWGRGGSPSTKSLPSLLYCESNPSLVLLRKFDSEETISFQQLNKHYVGLYMFVQGNFFQNIESIYQQCVNQDIDFEIVLVCLPFSAASLDPDVFQDVVCSILRKHQISNWWVFPYNNSVCRRLHNFCKSVLSDSMLMVGPNNKFVDKQVGEVVHYFGPHFGSQAFPFTMKELLQAYLQRLDEVTLESFLAYDYIYHDYRYDESKTIPVSELRGKNVIVYVTSYRDSKPSLEDECKEYCKWCDIIKEEDPDFEVVLVPVSYYVPDSEYPEHISKLRERIFKSRIRWLVCPFGDQKQSRFLQDHNAFLLQRGVCRVEMDLPSTASLAFEEDGHLHSLKAKQLVWNKGLGSHAFLRKERDQILRDEITQQLRYEFDLFDNTVSW